MKFAPASRARVQGVGECRAIVASERLDGTRSVTNEVVLTPGGQVTYRRHQQRHEVWTFTAGEGEVVVGVMIMGKYANEVYHLAGDYLPQLDPVDFNPVPPFVHDWCDSVFRGFAATLASASNP